MALKTLLIGFLAFSQTQGVALEKRDTLDPFTETTITQKTPSLASVFIPGYTQLKRGESAKGWTIIGTGALTLFSGFLFWKMSDSEYDKYLSLPYGTPQEEFDSHYNKSNLYGTLSIVSFAGFGLIYGYSIIDGFLYYKKQKSKETGFYIMPEKDGLIVAIKRNF